MPVNQARSAIGTQTPMTVASGRLRRHSSATAGTSINGTTHQRLPAMLASLAAGAPLPVSTAMVNAAWTTAKPTSSTHGRTFTGRDAGADGPLRTSPGGGRRSPPGWRRNRPGADAGGPWADARSHGPIDRSAEVPVSKVLDRVADAGGILYFVLVAVGFVFLASPYLPESLESPDAVVAHLEVHPPGTDLWVGLWLEGAGLAALVLLATRIAGRIRAAEPSGWLPLGRRRAGARRLHGGGRLVRAAMAAARRPLRPPDGHRVARRQRCGHGPELGLGRRLPAPARSRSDGRPHAAAVARRLDGGRRDRRPPRCRRARHVRPAAVRLPGVGPGDQRMAARPRERTPVREPSLAA